MISDVTLSGREYASETGRGATEILEGGSSNVYLTGNNTVLNATSSFHNKPALISVNPAQILAHELVDHALPHINGSSGTGYKGINKVLKENRVNKQISRKNRHRN